MRLVLLASCTLLLVMGVASAASGDRVYRWKGADGKMYYGDTPPATAQEVRNFDNKFSEPANVTAPSRAAPATSEEVAASEAECATKRNQLKTYRNAARLVETDALGREREYTAEERQLLVAKVESDITAHCSDAQ